MKTNFAILLISLLSMFNLCSQEKKTCIPLVKKKDASPVKKEQITTENLGISEINKNLHPSYYRVYFILILDEKGKKTNEYYKYFRVENETKDEMRKKLREIYSNKKYNIAMTYLKKGEIAYIYNGYLYGDYKPFLLGKMINSTKEKAQKKCNKQSKGLKGKCLEIYIN